MEIYIRNAEANWIKCDVNNKDLLHKHNIFIGDNIKVGKNVRIYDDCIIKQDNIIGDHVKIYWNSVIGYNNTISDNVEICSSVKIGNHNHIGKNSVIDMNAIIEDYVTINENVTIGIGVILSSLTKIENKVKIDDYTIVGSRSVIKTNLDCRLTIPPNLLINKKIKANSVEYLFLKYGILPNRRGNYTLYATTEGLKNQCFDNLINTIPQLLDNDDIIQATVNIKDITKSNFFIVAKKYSNPRKLKFKLFDRIY